MLTCAITGVLQGKKSICFGFAFSQEELIKNGNIQYRFKR